jgi:hypothetical protein
MDYKMAEKVIGKQKGLWNFVYVCGIMPLFLVYF